MWNLKRNDTNEFRKRFSGFKNELMIAKGGSGREGWEKES